MGKKSRDRSGKKARKKAAQQAIELALPPTGSAHARGSEGVTSVAAQDSPARRSVDSTELAARLASLSTVLQRHLARADAGDGLTRARLSALALLVLGGPRTLGELAAAERVRPPTMTRLVHAMEADGLVARESNPGDARSIIIRATPLGEQQLEVGRSRQIAPLAEAIARLDHMERGQLDDAGDVLGRVLRDSDWEPGVTRD